ncbi:hypothetical protein EJ04DRAFT_509240 [Polyplosphaeria fusca]|uniref:Uncharacterized protein n=1 Tax=Polyplosphaeria fusca TaxID=682080 RepID=A0A9P4V721_9PLEO|nr:hypothetical protein EJ04DRAFT_509240 [Polyplosphaeria fusca]
MRAFMILLSLVTTTIACLTNPHAANTQASLAPAAPNSTTPRASTPCPYHTYKKRIPHEYMVLLRNNHTLEAHFRNLGFNVSHYATKFKALEALNMYSITIDEYTIKDHVRWDPGVELVAQNIPVEFDDWELEERWGGEAGEMSEEEMERILGENGAG